MKNLSVIVFLLSLFLKVSAQQELSLMEAVEKALENNYDIRIQKIDEQIAGLNNHWGKAGRYPSLALSFNSNNKSDFNQNENYNQFQFVGGVTLSWTLFDGFRVNITKQRLEELEKLSKGNTAILVEGTVQSVVLAYDKVLLEVQKLEVYKANEKLSADRVEYQRLLKEQGRKPWRHFRYR